MLADADRAVQYEGAVQHVVGRAGPGAVCIVCGAAASLAMLAAACANVQQVICLQVHTAGTSWLMVESSCELAVIDHC